MIRIEALVLTCLVASGGCVTMDEVRGHIKSEAEKVVLERAAFDLQCDKNKLSVIELGAPVYEQKYGRHVFGVRGCEQQASYVAECNRDFSQSSFWGTSIGENEWPCQALLNSDSQEKKSN